VADHGRYTASFVISSCDKTSSSPLDLGLTLSTNLTWNAHIGNITSKANTLLGFLRRNLKIKNESTTYPTLSPTFQGDVGLLAGL
jgi:hypothetical protein